MNNLFSENLDFRKILSEFNFVFFNSFGLTPVVGCELEFYSDESKEYLQEFAKDNNVEISEEDGENQFEIKFAPTKDLVQLADTVSQIKTKMQNFANFSAKPYDDKPSSGLHVHINFLDKNGKNVYERKNSKTPKVLAYSIGGLLEIMEESCVLFAPHEDSYKRFTTYCLNSPSKVSWGVNNRTAAIRITPMEKGVRRMECRVASACADSSKVLTAIMSGIYFGIANRIVPQEPTYGLCNDPQYNLKCLPVSLEEARKKASCGNLPTILAEIIES